MNLIGQDMMSPTSQSAGLAMRGLKSAAQLAESKPHGDRMRYMGGCRCQECRRANSAYESARQKARTTGDWNGNVLAEKARAHLKYLSEQNVGRRTVRDVSGVGDTVLQDIIAGRKTNIRARTERAILAVTPAAAADHALVPAGPSWVKLNALITDGYTRSELSSELGLKSQGLQVGKVQVTVRKAYEIDRMFDRLQKVDAARADALLKELKTEGYTDTLIEQRMNALAELAGVHLEWPLIRRGRIRAKFETLLLKLHDELVVGVDGDIEIKGDNAKAISPEVLQKGLANGRYRIVEGVLHKKCNKCEECWPADSEFFHSAKNQRHKDGLNDICKACYASYWPKGRTKKVA